MQLFRGLKSFWESINGFILIAIILGIICFFIDFFQRETTPYSLIELINGDIFSALFGLLYLFGFTFLILHFIGNILYNHGNPKTPVENHSERFFSLSISCLLIFNIFVVPYFCGLLQPRYYAIIYCFNSPCRCLYCLPPFEISTGVFLSAIMFGVMILSQFYEELLLHQYYKKYLPKYTLEPKNSIN